MKTIRTLFIVFLTCLLLTGCVEYDVGIEFDSQTHGTIQQTIQLSERLTGFSRDGVNEWVSSLKQRVRRVQGRTQRVSDREILVTIPFNNGADLEEKFEQFFNPISPDQKGKFKDQIEDNLPQFSSNLDLTQNNFIFVLRNHLSLELDLRSLALLTTQEQVLIGSGELLELQFSLDTPWGAKLVESDGINPDHPKPLAVTSKQNGQLVWTLKPGEVNQLEALFWIPSPVGIGAVIIILFTYFGYTLKYALLPKLSLRKKTAPAEI
ncbi:DUF3153 domain-containing protein [Lyngbya sp. PCC 8106]|uniref:DUF3153 domain-containing protein n=1 Tax=Lyngbya sp. (strain PCC 8106) TaxID=313612 RepID=UPI0000EAC861|nr:DUF3153 domain-containing protein [Lyngbya sp. PCC 8106]EAW34727.1 hypothetical protein L8106_25455 [Lyngbya sp. PCC 8106]